MSTSSAAGLNQSSWLPCGRLGSGAFGHVSLALSLLDHSLFAIKSCPPSSSPLLLSSLLNELRILQSLRSPFIIRCLGAHLNDCQDPPSLFLEYMDGGSLADLLRRSGGKLSDETLVARYTRAILQGLHYLHQNGIVHCDIKSHNILLGSSGIIKIADFGAARRLPASGVKMDGMLRGTPLYMAPEVVQGVEQRAPSDIWSLGCTVVEMLQGRPPWGHLRNVAALFLKLGSSQDHESPPLPELASAEAKDFLQLCLQRDPKARPTAAELLQHPFVCSGKGGVIAGIDNCEEAGSPLIRSTVEFCKTGEWRRGDECYRASSMPIDVGVATTEEAYISGARSRKYKSEEMSVHEWITVKCSGAEDRHVPFMLQQPAGLAPAVLSRAESRPESSVDCATFLRNRRRRTLV